MNLKNFNDFISSREFSEKLRKEFKKGNYKSPAEAAKVILSNEIPDKDTLNNLIASSKFNQNWKDNLKITENMNTKLRQLIRESINEYIRDIDEAGNIAALEAKMGKTKEAIEIREKKMNMDGLDEAYHDMLDKGKMKEIGSEIKALKKSLAKYEKQLDKLKNKGKKSEEPKEEKEIVDEVNIDENFPENGPQLEEDEMNESFLHMQKLAGVLSEKEYNEKIEEARFKKGTDIGKKGKGFAKIAKSAAKEYGSKEAGKRVAGAILKKVVKK